jgi:carbon starvation protein
MDRLRPSFRRHFRPGPLVGPVLAAQFGYLPGTLWILIGVVLGGAVQDFVILFCSLRRDGRSLGQMVKDELNSAAGWVALLAILSILVILLAVLALVVVNALAESPWGVFTVGATIPIALFMGGYLRAGGWARFLKPRPSAWCCCCWRCGAGNSFISHAAWAERPFGSRRTAGLGDDRLWLCRQRAADLAAAGAARLFEHVHETGHDLSAGAGHFCRAAESANAGPDAFRRERPRAGFAGKLFPFCFITIACGAISGFHSLIASGTTPKILTREGYARPSATARCAWNRWWPSWR